jgi:aminocarboxymuconate-semialdehyde decarboxylase
MNERLGEVAQKHSGRVSMLASVPLQDADLAAAELEHGIKQCGAGGGVIAASVKGANLGEADLDRFWAAAVELDVPLFIHPTQPIPDPRAIKHGMVIIAQFLYDSTLTAGSLVFSGALDRFPKLNLILPHGGGFFPYQAGRFDRICRSLGPQAAPAQPPSAYLGRFYYDTILHHPAALGYLRDMVGSQQLLMGTDYPFPVDDQAPLQMLEETGFPAGEIAQISGDNARRLFRI